MARPIFAAGVLLAGLLTLGTVTARADDLTVAPVEPGAAQPGAGGVCCVLIGSPAPLPPAQFGASPAESAPNRTPGSAAPAPAGPNAPALHDRDGGGAGGGTAAGGAAGDQGRAEHDPADNPGRAGGQ